MKILLTNDDGIRAPGIAAMYDAFVDTAGVLGGPVGGGDLEVFVVAPDTVQSATSHGVTFHEPLMVRRAPSSSAFDGFSVGGRPADCVKVAVAELWGGVFGAGSRPDLVISGMNAGANCGINVIYSGTVGAALEAAFLGIPSIAVSLGLGSGRAMFDVAAAHGRRAIDRVLAAGLLGAGDCMNINIPHTEEPDDGAASGDDANDGDAVFIGAKRRTAARLRPDLVLSNPTPEMVLCPMNTHGLIDAYEKRTTPAGESYYWAAGGGTDFRTTDDGTDVYHLFQGRITLTPLSHDLTQHTTLDRWRSALTSE